MKIVICVNPSLSSLGEACSTFGDVTAITVATSGELERALPGADLLVLSNSTYTDEVADLLNRHGRDLSWIQFTSVGVDALERLGAPAGITVCNAAGLRSGAVAEHAIALLQAMTRRIVEIDRTRDARDWNAALSAAQNVGLLGGTQLHCLGYGGIGKKIAHIAKAFGMDVVAYNRSGEGSEPGIRVLPLDKVAETLPAADSIILCVPETAATRGIISANLIEKLKPGVQLVNVGRGGLVDASAILAALDGGRISGAALDVFDTEPLPADSPLWTHPKVILTPHIGGNGGDAVRLLAEIIHTGISRIKTGKPPLNIVEEYPRN